MSVLDLQVGRKARIVSIEPTEMAFEFLRKGVRPGMIIELKRKGLFGLNYYILLESYVMAVRNEEAASIRIEYI